MSGYICGMFCVPLFVDTTWHTEKFSHPCLKYDRDVFIGCLLSVGRLNGAASCVTLKVRTACQTSRGCIH
jgi:hypothetical protein